MLSLLSHALGLGAVMARSPVSTSPRLVTPAPQASALAGPHHAFERQQICRRADAVARRCARSVPPLRPCGGGRGTGVAGLVAFLRRRGRGRLPGLVSGRSFLGFLFGLPKTAPPAGAFGAAPTTGSAAAPQGPSSGQRYRPNTNLQEVSDWLTKIVVGVGLTQVANLNTYLVSFPRRRRRGGRQGRQSDRSRSARRLRSAPALSSGRWNVSRSADRAEPRLRRCRKTTRHDPDVRLGADFGRGWGE